jgi:hypothetical protein
MNTYETLVQVVESRETRCTTSGGTFNSVQIKGDEYRTPNPTHLALSSAGHPKAGRAERSRDRHFAAVMILWPQT